ncbi:Dynein regulatory complex subunit 2 [Frankliniella fusca]|uniref:Dynein regulatory complex subunit 2 n=1 Tax=Frankliniella fusca TaxID=407009 RepID=A0AAE1HRX8_9NEOP|nr:Dynein regulatory complex subunit 2 [Frankliniella fusca]
MGPKQKKPKLSKEERRARRLARREAARLRRVQRELQAKKDWLDRETRATEMNAMVIKRKWRDLMRGLRAPQLHDDIVALRLRTERLLDMKRAMIEELREALDQANDQYNDNLQHHVEIVDKMLMFYHDAMAAAAGGYRDALAALGEGLAQQKAAIQEREGRAAGAGHLEVLLFAMEQRQAEATVQRRAETTAKIDDEASKGVERCQVLQTGLEAELERLWAELGAELERHHERHAERRAAVAKLRAKEQAVHRVIAEQKRRTHQLSRQIEEGVELMRAWDAAEPGAAAATWAELRALRCERDEFRAAYLALRAAMDSQRQLDRKQLNHMVVQAEAGVKRLREVAACGEKILAMACLCNALETPEERCAYPEFSGAGFEELHALDRGSPRAVRHELPAEESHTCFTNDGEDLAAELGRDQVLDEKEDNDEEEAVTAERRRAALLRAAFQAAGEDAEPEPEVDLVQEAVSSLEGLAAFWQRAGAAELERRRLRAQVAQLRDEQLQLREELRGYLRRVAPTWWGSEPVPRGPPSLAVYEPPRALGVPPATPWRGIRARGALEPYGFKGEM